MDFVTDREANVLQQLLGGDRYGMQIVEGSRKAISRNTVYVLLGRMEDKDLITGRAVPAADGESGPPRRVYRITKLGKASLSAYDAAAAAMKAGKR